MSKTVTVRMPKPLAQWLETKASRSGLSQGKIIREQLELARNGDKSTKKYLRFAGVIKGGARDLSMRKGFSRG